MNVPHQRGSWETVACLEYSKSTKHHSSQQRTSLVSSAQGVRNIIQCVQEKGGKKETMLLHTPFCLANDLTVAALNQARVLRLKATVGLVLSVT